MFIPRLSGFNGKEMVDVSLEEIVESAVEDTMKEFIKSGKSGLEKSIILAVAYAISWQEAQE